MTQSVRLPVPHHGNYVWRYMRFERFEELLSSSTMHFTNASVLTDKYEVTLPTSSLLQMRRKSAGDSVASRQRALWLKRAATLKRSTWVSCWSTRRHESYALWKIYLRGERQGVAIRTTYSHFERAFLDVPNPLPHRVEFGSVQYVNYLPEPLPEPQQIICTKKPFYDFETELRAFIIGPEHGKHAGPHRDGLAVPVRLKSLLQSVVASPFADTDFVHRVWGRLQDAGFGIPVHRSAILDK